MKFVRSKVGDLVSPEGFRIVHTSTVGEKEFSFYVTSGGILMKGEYSIKDGDDLKGFTDAYRDACKDLDFCKSHVRKKLSGTK